MKLLFTLTLLLSVIFCTAQVKKKTSEKPPTQSEMKKMMKEAQAALDNLDPETKKMMDSMNIKMPSLKNVPKVSDKQLAKAWEDEERIVPKKDDQRISAISKTALSITNLGDFLKTVNVKINALLKPTSKVVGEKILSNLGSTGRNKDAIGNTAAALWMMGRLEPALYVMGKVCAEDVSNNDNLSNYAAMLSMSGVQQSAIPVLNYLNSKYPSNSTVLNNLGQAWFGLGDLTKAEKYLDSAIKIYAYHPQANSTKALIAENRGNKTEAITLVKKSLLHSYSQEKEERLRKLGYKLSYKDVSLPPNPKKDGLNLGAFSPPPFPKSVDECIGFKRDWENFRQQLKTQGAAVESQLEAAMNTTVEMHNKRTKEYLSNATNAIAGGSNIEMAVVPLHAISAGLKIKEVQDDYERKLEKLMQKQAAFLTTTGVSLKEEYELNMEKLQEQNLEQTGEGLPNKDFCPKYKELSDKYLRAYNEPMEGFFKENLQILKSYLNDITHWQLYAEWPEKFEASKLYAKASWLGGLYAEEPSNFISITEFKCVKPPFSKAGALAAFDDVACKYHSEITFPIGKMKMDCSRLTTELDLSVVKFGLKQDMDKETFSDQFMECSVEVGVKVGKDVQLGPLSVEASAGSRIGIEIGRNGVKDIYVTGGVKAGIGTNMIGAASEASETPSSMLGVGVGDLSIDAGVEGKISIISGRGSIYGIGIFEK